MASGKIAQSDLLGPPIAFLRYRGCRGLFCSSVLQRPATPVAKCYTLQSL